MDPQDKVILAILDGWGIAQPSAGNAISLAKTPNMTKLWSSYPHTQLSASGQSVGLPKGEPGNTETGHLNIGAGRIVYQDLERINISIADGSFYNNKVFIEAIDRTLKISSRLHLIGLVGAGGVHSNLEHLFALIHLAKTRNIKNLSLHLITDGRDSPPTSSQSYINMIEKTIQKEGIGTISTIMGRYWAMDRDRRWDRTERAYNALTLGEGLRVKTAQEAIQNSYSEGKTDEFIDPSVITDTQGNPLSLISDNDSVIFFNFRIDRPRQLTAAFIVDDFENKVVMDFDPYSEKYGHTQKKEKINMYQKTFSRKKKISNLYFATMTEYSKSLVNDGEKVAFPPEVVSMPLSKVISINNGRQLHASESEKERFVTFYFNGQQELEVPGQDNLIVLSPNVETYDKVPEMSAYELTEKVLSALKNKNYNFCVINYANPDMVGHSGSIGPAVKACEAVDDCVGKLSNFTMAYGGNLLITADHGNAEDMINLATGQISTEHSGNPVPFIAVSKLYFGKPTYLQSGILADIAPTVLNLLKYPVPTAMTGRNLLANVETVT